MPRRYQIPNLRLVFSRSQSGVDGRDKPSAFRSLVCDLGHRTPHRVRVKQDLDRKSLSRSAASRA
jgi:hypothetical protein